MRIGILTATRTDNNGTDLQAMAMQNLFSKYSKNVELIDYECPKLESKKHILSPLSLKKIIKLPMQLYTHYAHEKFRHLFKKTKCRYKSDTLQKVDFDIIVVGSDQIWNLEGTGYDLMFFLPFSTSAIKCSYAASMGRTDLTEWEKKFGLSKYLREFKAISVREESGVEALSKIGIQSEYVLDPILMGEKEDWINCIHQIREKYVFLLLVEENKEAVRYAQEYAKQNNCDVIMPTNGIRSIKGIKMRRFIGVEDWLSYMFHSELVVTNSYHTLSFAVLFEKDFTLFTLKEGSTESNCRMIDLLSRIDLNNRLFKSGTTQVQDTINWEDVKTKLNDLRRMSDFFIRTKILKYERL